MDIGYMNHPAKYTDVLLPIMAKMLGSSKIVLDQFAGTGKVFKLYDLNPCIEKIVGIEIEPEWVALDSRLTLGDALSLPFEDESFDAIVTSPTYGNRMADTLLDKYKRITYTSALGRKLNANNSGSLQWGERYRRFHIDAWKEARRVLKNKGIFVLNIKNHIRAGQEQLVTEWHVETLGLMQFEIVDWEKVSVPSMRYGANGGQRAAFESVIKFILYK